MPSAVQPRLSEDTDPVLGCVLPVHVRGPERWSTRFVEGVRCPFCYRAAEAAGSVLCLDCRARHHAGCWEEAKCCCSCKGSRRLGVFEHNHRVASYAVRLCLKLVGVSLGGVAVGLLVLGLGEAAPALGWGEEVGAKLGVAGAIVFVLGVGSLVAALVGARFSGVEVPISDA